MREVEESLTPKERITEAEEDCDIVVPQTEFEDCSGRGSTKKKLQDQGSKNLSIF